MTEATKKNSKSSTKTSAAKSVEDIITATQDDVMDASVEDIISDDNDEDSLSDITGNVISDKEILPESLSLYAKADILYSSHQYSQGEELPTDDPQMIDAWLRADTAEWR